MNSFKNWFSDIFFNKVEMREIEVGTFEDDWENIEKDFDVVLKDLDSIIQKQKEEK